MVKLLLYTAVQNRKGEFRQYGMFNVESSPLIEGLGAGGGPLLDWF